MRVPVSWLRELVPVELPPEELGDLLAMKGAHVESIDRSWEGLQGVVVARVLEVRDHPSSDRLCVARIQHGSGETELVVGVRNMVAGDLVPWAPPGGRVPALGEPLSPRQIRGVMSNGMLCSPRELGISQDHGGILVLEDLEVGADVAASLGLDDTVLDLEIESNRPDLLSILGIAREVAGAAGLPLRRPGTEVDEVDEAADDAATIRIEAPDACARYVARVILGLGSGGTPLGVQARLTAAGTRPISPAVDATNYVMLELGQPLHAFDLARLAGSGIVVRRAVEGERLTTLDDVERELVTSDLLICDLERPVAIAGVMGGATGEVGPDTSDVLLESASFEARGVLRTSRRLQLLTEASTRFSRGVDPEAADPAAARAAGLMAAWAGARVLRGAASDGAVPPRETVRARTSRATALLGYEVTPEDAVAALATIEIEARADGDDLQVTVPGFRPDIRDEVDVLEELVRIRGYDRLLATLPAIRQAGGEQDSYVRRGEIRELLVQSGLREAVSLSFASKADLGLLGHGDAVAVANPPSADAPFLRTSLLPGLLGAVTRNADRGVRSVALFEVGHVFRLADPVDEREHVAAVLWGPAGEGLYAEDRELDVLDAKGALEELLRGLRVDAWSVGGPPGEPFHPGRSCEILVGDATVGVMGELSRPTREGLGVEGRVALFEVDVDAVEPARSRAFLFRDVPRFPPVRRDLALAVPVNTPAGNVRSALDTAAGELLAGSQLFDVFDGPPLRQGSKSLAFSVEFRAADRTLTDDEAQVAVDRIVARLREEFGAELRAG